jgi:hypothetical protein
MTLTDSFLSNAGWLFFAAWTVMVAAVTIIAFGRDLLPWKSAHGRAHLDATPPLSTKTIRSTQSRAL